MKNTTQKLIGFAAALALIAATAGCNKNDIFSHAGSFGLGWLLGNQTAPTQVTTQCYVNGEEVDCATLDLE